MNVQTIQVFRHFAGQKKPLLLRHVEMGFMNPWKIKSVTMATDLMEMAAAVSVKYNSVGSVLTIRSVWIFRILKPKTGWKYSAETESNKNNMEKNAMMEIK